MGRTCGEPNEIKKSTHPENVTALFKKNKSARRFGPSDKLHAPELLRILKEAKQDIPPALAKFSSSRITFDD